MKFSRVQWVLNMQIVTQSGVKPENLHFTPAPQTGEWSWFETIVFWASALQLFYKCVSFVWLSLNTSASIYGTQKTIAPRPGTGVRGSCDLGIGTKRGSSMRTVSILARTVPAPEAIILSKTLSCTDEGLRLCKNMAYSRKRSVDLVPNRNRRQ